MDWRRLLKKDSGKSDIPSVHSIRFDTGGWTSTKSRRSSLEWSNADGDTLRASIHGKLTAISLVISDLDSLRAFYRQEAARNSGGIVCVEIVQAEGIRAVKVINKYERRPAYAYDGHLIIPFKNAEYTITMDSIERGTTGERDALVTCALAQTGELEIEPPRGPDEPGRIKGWFQDPYDSSYTGQAIYSMSDDDRLDPLFPKHPLSKIRACLARIQSTLAIDVSSLREAIPVPSNTREDAGSSPTRHLLSPSTLASLYFDFGSSLLEVGKSDECEKLVGRLISELELTVCENDLIVARQLLLLGLAYENQGKYVEAETVLSRCLTIFKSNLGHDHPETAQAMLNLGRMHIALNRYDAGEPLLKKAMRIFEDKQVPGSSVGVALNELGLVHNARGLYTQALPCFERALEIIQKVHGPDFTDCATVLRNMAVSLQKIGEDRRAIEALGQAQQIDHKTGGASAR